VRICQGYLKVEVETNKAIKRAFRSHIRERSENIPFLHASDFVRSEPGSSIGSSVVPESDEQNRSYVPSTLASFVLMTK